MAENTFNGIINVYKEQDFTSFDVVAKLRGICGMRKIGHTGTLDPDATGVLPVCLGNATKVCDLLTDHEKEYVAELLLGIRTDTQDVSGMPLSGEKSGNMERAMQLPVDEIREAILSFQGKYEQIPPMYSALKVDGQKLYDLARKGIEVERKARTVEIKEIEILSEGTFSQCAAGQAKRIPLHEALNADGLVGLPVIRMRVLCSKGTYIRTLCEDIGEKLGCGGTMLSLQRTQVGPFDIASALTLQQLQACKDAGSLASVVQSVDSLFMEYPKFVVKPEYLKYLQNGNKLKLDMVTMEEAFPLPNQRSTAKEHALQTQSSLRGYGPDGAFVGIYSFEAKYQELKPVKLFF